MVNAGVQICFSILNPSVYGNAQILELSILPNRNAILFLVGQTRPTRTKEQYGNCYL